MGTPDAPPGASAPQRTDTGGSGSTIETTAVDEDVDNGLRKPAVWASVHLWLENPELPNSEIAKKLKIHTSTVGRHLKAWNDVQRKMAQERSIEQLYRRYRGPALSPPKKMPGPVSGRRQFIGSFRKQAP